MKRFLEKGGSRLLQNIMMMMIMNLLFPATVLGPDQGQFVLSPLVEGP